MVAGQHLKAVKATVHGHVQDVGFRYRALWAADEQGLAGWVRNEADGTVRLHAEGPERRVDHFLTVVRGGFPGTRVTRVDVTMSTPQGYKEFRITS